MWSESLPESSLRLAPPWEKTIATISILSRKSTTNIWISTILVFLSIHADNIDIFEGDVEERTKNFGVYFTCVHVQRNVSEYRLWQVTSGGHIVLLTPLLWRKLKLNSNSREHRRGTNILWPWKLKALQLKKTHANEVNTFTDLTFSNCAAFRKKTTKKTHTYFCIWFSHFEAFVTLLSKCSTLFSYVFLVCFCFVFLHVFSLVAACWPP